MLFEKLPIEKRVVIRPIRRAGVVRNELLELVEFRVERVDEMERDRLARHGDLGRAELGRSVMRKDHVLKFEREQRIERGSADELELFDFAIEEFRAEIQMAESLSFVAIGGAERVADKFDRLADVVKKRADDEKIVIDDLGILSGDELRELHHGDGMFKESADVRVMKPNARVRTGKARHEVFIVEKNLNKRAERRSFHGLKDFAQPRRQGLDVLFGAFDEIVGDDVGRVRLREFPRDDLKFALIELDGALDANEVAFRELLGELFRSVPEKRDDGSGPVANVKLEIARPAFIDAERLIAHAIDVGNDVVFFKLVDKKATHNDLC